MSKHPLEILLGSRGRHKILRFLYRNVGQSHTLAEMAERTQEDISTVRREVQDFMEAGLIMKTDEKETKN